MSWVNFILNMDRRIIFTLVAVCVVLPLLVMFNFPLKTTPDVEAIYNAIDALQPGDPILISADFDPASKAELLPMLDAALAHCFAKGLHPVVMTLWPAAPGLVQQSVETQAALYGKVKGTDYVFLGYRPGNYAVVQGVVDGIANTYATDHYGTPINTLPLMSNVKRYTDFKYFLEIAAGNSVEVWLAYAAGKFNVPMAVSCTGVSVAQYAAFLGSGQIAGLAGGMKGSAEYEKLLREQYAPDGQVTRADGSKAPMPAGIALQGMDAQSMVHMFIVFSIILANACYFIKRRGDAVIKRSA